MSAIEDAQRYDKECTKVPRAALKLLFPPETGCSGFSGPELARADNVIQSTRTPFKNAEATTPKANTVNRNPYNERSFPR
jgi:hypothetical protein